MYKKWGGLLAGCGLAAMSASTVYAANVTVDNVDLTLSGGASGGYYYSTHNGSSGVDESESYSNDNFYLSDLLLQISHDAKAGGDVGFTAGIGTLQEVDVLGGGGYRDSCGVTGLPQNGCSGDNFGLQYGWVTYMPIDNLSLQAGKLATNVGTEAATSYANPNITNGALWFTQPLYYRGVRATYAVGSILNVYAEVDKDSSVTDLKGNAANAQGFGVNGTFSGWNWAANYFNYIAAGHNTVDLDFSGTVAGVDLGINADYDFYDDTIKDLLPSGVDDHAEGVALYVTPHLGKWAFPVRLEGGYSGTSGIFGNAHSLYTATFTPTYHVTDHTFVRAEVSGVKASSDGKFYYDQNGSPADTKLSVAAQAGINF